MGGPPTYLEELTCPCCIPALGEFREVPPRGGSAPTLVERAGRAEIRPGDVPDQPPTGRRRPAPARRSSRGGLAMGPRSARDRPAVGLRWAREEPIGS